MDITISQSEVETENSLCIEGEEKRKKWIRFYATPPLTPTAEHKSNFSNFSSFHFLSSLRKWTKFDYNKVLPSDWTLI